MKLVIAEKPSVAAAIAAVIGANKKENGHYQGNGYVVSWCVGHLVQLAPPENYDDIYKKWDLATLPIIPSIYKTVISNNTKEQYQHLKQLMERADIEELIEATDAGREGELIFRLVYDKAKCKKPFKRLWISSMEEEAIKKGFAELRPSAAYDNLYHSALCRQRADWLVGLNATRMYSCLYNKKLTIGRVQTPTINIIVKRQRDIDSFIPKTYYSLKADCGSFSARTQADSKQAADEICARCSGARAYVVSVEQKEKNENAPALYDLTTLQRDANRKYGFSAQETLDIAQKLYEAKLTTYPRTDSRYITDDMETPTRSLIEKLTSKLAEYDTNKINMSRVVNNKKVTDHHAIIPTVMVLSALPSSLNDNDTKILNLVIQRLISAPYAPYKYKQTKAVLDIEGELFTATGREIIDEGYKAVVKDEGESGKDKDDSEETARLPEMSEGNEYTALSVTSEEKKTKPPKLYTEDTLLEAMETAGRAIDDDELREAMKDKGLGTTATRAGIIEKIIKVGYIKREKKNLIPTPQAITLCELLPIKLKEPTFTAEWEKQLEEISAGNRSDDIFMEDIAAYVKELTEGAEMRRSIISDKDRYEEFKTEREEIGKCPRCGKPVYENTVAFSCSSGKGGCGFAIFKNAKFFESKKKKITKKMVSELLNKGKTKCTKLYSEKSGKEYDAWVLLDDNGQYVNFKLEFINKK